MLALSIDTAAGPFRIRLFSDSAPATCQYFCDLVSRGLLADAVVFRITTEANHRPSGESPIEVIQIGTPLGLDENRQHIPHEPTSTTGLEHRRFTVSASRFEPGELYRSFFVCMRDEPALDFGGGRQADGQGYAAFGEVAEGHATVERIFANASADEFLDPPIPIQEIHWTT